MKIRDLEQNDIPSAADIFLFHNKPEGWHDTPEYFEGELKAMFENKFFVRPKYIVCENDEGKIIGVAGYSNTGFDDDVFGLFWAIVHPDYQNQGVGKLLVQERIERIKKDGGKVIFSTTKKLWHLERFGFKAILDREDGYKLMMLQLE